MLGQKKDKFFMGGSDGGATFWWKVAYFDLSYTNNAKTILSHLGTAFSNATLPIETVLILLSPPLPTNLK